MDQVLANTCLGGDRKKDFYSVDAPYVRNLDAEIMSFIMKGIHYHDDHEFNRLAIMSFELQFNTVAPYREYSRKKGVTPGSVRTWREIPAVPSRAFKEFVLATFPIEKAEHAYFTSGTTEAMKKGKIFRDPEAVKLVNTTNGILTREYVFPDAIRQKILLMTPSPTLAPGMGMAVGLERVRTEFGTPDSTYLITKQGLDVETLLRALIEAEDTGKPLALVGSTSGLIYFFNACEKEGIRFSLPKGSRICDGGGYLGQFGECSRDEYLERIFAPPDIIVASNNPCIAESKSFLFAVQKYNVPYHFVDCPLNVSGRTIDDKAAAYYVEQLKGLLDFLAQHGMKLDMTKLSEVLARSKEMVHLLTEVDEYRKQRPAPMSFPDGLTCTYLMIYYPGHAEALETYRRLRDEVKQRAENKLGTVEDERYRLLFLGVPPFYNMGLLNYPEKYGGVFVKGEMEYVGSGQIDINILDPERPLESIARKAIIDWPNPLYTNRFDLMLKTLKEFQIDGIIAAFKRGCRNLPAGFKMIKDIAAREAGVPMTLFDLDGLDLREYNDMQVKSNIDAFMETLTSKR